MLPGFLASQAALLAKHPMQGMVYGMPERIDEQGRYLGTYDTDTTPSGSNGRSISGYRRTTAPAGVHLIDHDSPRRTFDVVGLFDPTYPLAVTSNSTTEWQSDFRSCATTR